MQAALRPCPRCLSLHRGKCPKCQRERDQARGGARVRGYSREWDAYSRKWLARYPWCGQRLGGAFSAEHSACARAGLQIAATVTDHIIALRDGGALFVPTNHQSLCTSCNTAKSSPR